MIDPPEAAWPDWPEEAPPGALPDDDDWTEAETLAGGAEEAILAEASWLNREFRLESPEAQAERSPAFAEVCVNTPLGRMVGTSLGADRPGEASPRTFTYTVPPRLAGRVEPGHLVWVPFRSRRLQAIVLSVHDRAPAFKTLEIESLVWAQPVLTGQQLELAHWLSDYYVSPLIEALRLMLPARISQRGQTVFARTRVPAPADLTPGQAALLAQIAEGEGTWAEISAGLGKVTQQADLEPLIAAGVVSREVAFAAPPPRAKVNRRVRLLADDATVARVLPSLGRTSAEADILAWLAAQDDPLPSLADLCRTTGCTPERVRQLAKGGRFAVLPSRALVRRCVPDSALPGVLETLGKAKKKATALAALPLALVDEAEFRAGHRVDLATLRALVDLNYAERIEEPAQVSLALDRDAMTETIIELHGTQKHRAALAALQAHDGSPWIGWLYAETGATRETLHDLEAAGLITLVEEVIWRDPLAGQEFRLDRPPALTADQEAAWAEIAAAIDGSAPKAPYLLYGVTGSGKTEIYLRGIAAALEHGQQAVVLVPEIALTPQTVQRFAARFPGRVTVWHSDLNDGERFDMWRRVRTNHPAAQVVVGSRSALFLPFPDLGLVVVDEEHESSYKQERTPRYHARTVALELGQQAGIPVVLGSATPALETYYAARQGAIRILSLPRRVIQETSVKARPVPAAGEAPSLPGILEAGTPAPHGDLPGVEIVDMRHELRVGNRSMFSRSLTAALQSVLGHGQQAILYLNRRGSASFVMCRDCGHVESCPRCAVPLTYHGTGNILVCHHCNRRYPVPTICVKCKSRRIRYFGSGTQNLEEAVHHVFPAARTLRWDRDVTGAKGSHEAILSRFASHQADVLIGTQMIAKGLDLPLVTLVGVIAADTGLFLPDFRAGERTFQLLTQVAGRAGRSQLGGRVVIQTYRPDHYAIVAASHHDFEGFYRQEMTFRREQGYPPLRRLARLLYLNGKNDKAQAEATRVAEILKAEIAADPEGLAGTDLIGPAPCFFTQERGAYRWQVVIRSPDPAPLLHRLSLDIGWRIDVDPTNLL
ncbi:MAG TPA: primosomal protein N' [Anaerolineae bacterium]